MADEARPLNRTIYYIGFVVLIALGLAYVFWGADLIPESIQIPPGQVLAWVDDIAAVIALIFVWRKWKIIMIGGKEQKGQGILATILYLLIIAFGLWYVFLGVDLIPDGSPFFGWMDDAMIVVGGVYAAGKIKRWLKG